MSAKQTQVGGKHYADLAIQPVEYIHKNDLGFCEGCVVKYVTRWRAKGGIEDLRKARHFIDLLIEMETTPDVEWPDTDERIDIIAASGGQGEHYISAEDGAGVWTVWNGGECPCDELTRVEVMMRDGERSQGAAERFRWAHIRNSYDIIRYRLL